MTQYTRIYAPIIHLNSKNKRWLKIALGKTKESTKDNENMKIEL